MILITYLKWFLDLFKPQNFENQPYYWLLNQLGHTTLGVLISWFINPYIAILFIIVWEVIQYFKSKDWKDGLEDAIFVILGAIIYLFFSKVTVLIALAILIFRLYQKYYR